MKVITISADKATISAFGKDISGSCVVENLESGSLPKIQVEYSTNIDGSRGVPYSPQPFPSGAWNIFRPLPRTDPYEAPFFIPTDAWQMVDEWEVVDGAYTGKKTGRQVSDHAYGIHHSTAVHTFGCEKVMQESDLLWLVGQINDTLDTREGIQLIVL